MFVPDNIVSVTPGVTNSSSDQDLAPPSAPPHPANEITGFKVGSENVIVTKPRLRHFDKVAPIVYSTHSVSPVVVNGSRVRKYAPGSVINPVFVKFEVLPPRWLNDSDSSNIQMYGPLTATLYVTPFGSDRWRADSAYKLPVQLVLFDGDPATHDHAVLVVRLFPLNDAASLPA
jgi:hypothetical protein